MEDCAVKNELDFSIRLGGDKSIEVSDLINSLECTKGLMNYIVLNSNMNASMSINVTSTSEGSFVVNLLALVNILPSLFTHDNIENAKNIFDIFCGLFKLKKHFKGEPPKSTEIADGYVKIENKDSEKVTVNVNVYNFYNEETDKYIGKMFENNKRDFFEIKEKDDSKLKIEKKEYVNMTKVIELKKEEAERVIKNTMVVTLGIRKPDLTGETPWEFIYNKKIKAYIKDAEFLSKVHKGEISINSKTSIEVELECEIHYDDKNSKVLKEEYYINHVFEIKNERSEQISI